jgi:hypothetical protein
LIPLLVNFRLVSFIFKYTIFFLLKCLKYRNIVGHARKDFEILRVMPQNYFDASVN